MNSIHKEVNIIDNYTELWHKRLHHISEEGVHNIIRKNYVFITGTHLNTYTHCLIDKQHRIIFHILSFFIKLNILDLIHT